MQTVKTIQAAEPMSWFRGFVQGKTRITLAWIFAILLVISTRESPSWQGIGICFLGACLRFWASGYLRKDNHPAVGGPYSWVRNPLYVGTFLMAAGTAVSIGQWALLVLITAFYFGLYRYIVLDEETKLRRIFGVSYVEYCQKVPRFVPTFRSFFKSPSTRSLELRRINPDLDQHRFSWDLALKNKAYEAFASFAALIGFVELVAFLWKNYFAG